MSLISRPHATEQPREAELTEEAFAALFRPTKNHLNASAPFDWGTTEGTLFDTSVLEHDHVITRDPARIWTLCSTDEGDCILSGYHFVNRLGYFITEYPVPAGVQISVPLDREEDTADSSQQEPGLANRQRQIKLAQVSRLISDYDPHGDERENLVDLITDAMHWCEELGEPFEEFYGTAAQHFAVETTTKGE